MLFLTVIASTCNFLEHIVSDVLVIQRLETNMLTLNPSLCSMSEVRNFTNIYRGAYIST
jgi:hypothetical protein